MLSCWHIESLYAAKRGEGGQLSPSYEIIEYRGEREHID